MSKSLKRVVTEAEENGISLDVLELTVSTKTAQQAADAIDVHVDQIAKSIIFRGATSDTAILFLTAGGNRVDQSKAETVAGEPLTRADAAFIREKTGFAIGGVSPIGHIQPVRAFLDLALLKFPTIWAAAGTPNHMFEIKPKRLADLANATPADFTELKNGSE